MKAPFTDVVNAADRKYARAYWRYLLGWEPSPPDGDGIPAKTKMMLRLLARKQADRSNVKKEGKLCQMETTPSSNGQSSE